MSYKGHKHTHTHTHAHTHLGGDGTDGVVVYQSRAFQALHDHDPAGNTYAHASCCWCLAIVMLSLATSIMSFKYLCRSQAHVSQAHVSQAYMSQAYMTHVT